MKKRGYLSIMLLVLAAVFAFTGCMGRVITEDPLYVHLPDVDPDDGVEKDVNVTLYYRLTNEAYLVGVDRSVAVTAGEQTENAVIRTLIDGVPMLVPDISALFSGDTELVNVKFENGILYVTLSEEFLDESIVDSIDREVYMSEESYYEAIYLATQEMYLRRKLAALSIVNTITGSSDDVKVQLLIQDGSDSARMLTKVELGLDKEDNSFVEPMGFDKEIIANSENVTACFIDNIADREYEKAYVLLAESDYSGAERPAYSEFETLAAAPGNLTAFEITGMYTNDIGEYALAELNYTMADGTIKQVKNARLYIETQSGMPKVSYGSFRKIMENLANESGE